MVHYLKNVTASIISLGYTLNINPNSDLIIYNDITFEINTQINLLISTSELSYPVSGNNLNYNIDTGKLVYYRDSQIMSADSFYQWFNSFKRKFSILHGYTSQGFVTVKLDANNNKLVFGNTTLQITDLPDNIPATKIANGSISNLEFQTLDGIDTSKTIQQQLDSKANTVHSHTQTFYLNTPSLTWTITHNYARKPSVEVYDLTGEIVEPTIKHTSNNTLQIIFSKAMSAYANLTI